MDEMGIKEAAERLGIEAYVLRYWEDELRLDIKRNKMGHRCYDERDIKMFKEIQELKAKGLSLKDIRNGIEKHRNLTAADNGEKENPDKNEGADVKVVDFRLAQLQNVMNKIIANALRENRDIITSSVKSEITADVMRQFDAVMREKEEREEERFRKLDCVLRQMQLARDEAAASKRGGIFRRKRQ